MSLGTRLADCLTAADDLAAMHGAFTVADARFAKPLDTDLIDRLATSHDRLLIVEENSPGGFSAHVMQYLANAGHLDRGLVVRCMSLPDRMIDHDSQAGQIALAGLHAEGIADTLRAMPGLADANAGTSGTSRGASRGGKATS